MFEILSQYSLKIAFQWLVSWAPAIGLHGTSEARTLTHFEIVMPSQRSRVVRSLCGIKTHVEDSAGTFFKFSCSLAFATSCHVSRRKTPPHSRAASASPLNLVRVVVALRLKRRIWVDLCTRQNLGIRIPFLRACHQKLRSALLRLAAIRFTTKRRCLGQGADLPCHEATVPPAADDVLQLGSHNLTSLGMMNTLLPTRSRYFIARLT